ncbi:hypothetical protein [Streptomyces sp. NPDC048623]
MKPAEISAVVLLVVGIIASLLIWTSAPCGIWTLGKVGDMPARCITK